MGAVFVPQGQEPNEMYRALVVDADHDKRTTLLGILNQSGYDAVAVRSMNKARALLKHQQFDCVLLDTILPDGSGLTLCDDIRERAGHTMVIIFVSSNTVAAHRIAALQLGADDFLTTPVDPEELLMRIAAHLRHTRSSPT